MNQHYLFVCRDGQFRSQLACSLLEERFAQNAAHVRTSFFGVRGSDSNEEKKRLLDDADYVFVMEENMVFDITQVLRYSGAVDVLDVPDGLSYQLTREILLDRLEKKVFSTFQKV